MNHLDEARTGVGSHHLVPNRRKRNRLFACRAGARINFASAGINFRRGKGQGVLLGLSFRHGSGLSISAKRCHVHSIPEARRGVSSHHLVPNRRQRNRLIAWFMV
jgi:hypothetical protein